MMRRVPGTHDADLTKAALLEAAAELFAEHGLAGTTAEMIAGRARVNKAMINYYFRTKEALYEEILASTLKPLADLLDWAGQTQLRPDERLRHFIQAFAEMHTVHPNLSTMILREVISGAEGVSDRLLPHFLRLVRHVTGIVEDGVREKIFRPVDPFQTHFSLISTLVYFFATAKARNHLIATKGLPARNPTADEYVNHLQELFLRGLAADPKTETNGS
jgi:AcrR family transcriptional regulator